MANSNNDRIRYSDEKLFQLHNEVKEHINRSEERFKKGDEQFQQLIQAQKSNTDAITVLIGQTEGIIKLHRDLQGAARVGQSVRKFSESLLKIGVVGILLAAAYDWILKEIIEHYK